MPLAGVGVLCRGKRKFYVFASGETQILRFASGETQILRFASGETQILAYSDTNMLVSPTQNSGVGGLSQREGPTQLFCIAVEREYSLSNGINNLMINACEEKSAIKKLFCHFYFLNIDISLNI